jgi:hypothetical protein
MYCSGGIYNFQFEMDDDSRAVAAGPSNGKHVAQPNSSKDDPQSNHSDNDNTALSAAAGLAGAVIVGAIIEQFIESSRCNTPVPKPFEKGTLNAAILRAPVVEERYENQSLSVMATKKRTRELSAASQILCQFQGKMTGVFGENEHEKTDEVTVYLRQAMFLRWSCITI